LSDACAAPPQIAYNIDVVRDLVPEALEILVDAVLNPKFHEWEVAEQVQRLKADLKNVADNPSTLLLEVRGGF
jgi:mitochondrial-processing peptidase subunit alpha